MLEIKGHTLIARSEEWTPQNSSDMDPDHLVSSRNFLKIF